MRSGRRGYIHVSEHHLRRRVVEVRINHCGKCGELTEQLKIRYILLVVAMWIIPVFACPAKGWYCRRCNTSQIDPGALTRGQDFTIAGTMIASLSLLWFLICTGEFPGSSMWSVIAFAIGSGLAFLGLWIRTREKISLATMDEFRPSHCIVCGQANLAAEEKDLRCLSCNVLTRTTPGAK